MDSKRLLLLTTEFPPQPGGIGNHAYHLAKHLTAHSFKVTVVADQRSLDSAIEHEFDIAQSFKVVRVKRYGFIWFTYLKRGVLALRLLKKNETVLLSGKFSIWMGGFLSLFSSKKRVAVIHGSEVAMTHRLAKHLTKSCLRRCHTVIAVSGYTHSLVADWGLKNTVVIPNGFSIAVPDRIAAKPINPIQLITVGNVTQRKGQHNVIKALPLILKTYPETTYHIVGIPTEKERLLHLAKELGVADSILFHGKVSEKQKIKLLKQSTLFVMLSQGTPQGDVEGFGIAILEANALGIPAVGAMGCGIEDAIFENSSGKLVPFDDEEIILQAISEILQDYEGYTKRALKWSQQFTWPIIIKTYIEVLAK